jgi:hypothetical protein
MIITLINLQCRGHPLKKLKMRRPLELLAIFWALAPTSVWGWLPATTMTKARCCRVITSASGADDLQEQARKLRKEITAFEQEKTKADEAEKRIQDEAEMAKQTAKDYYSAVLPILKPDGTTTTEKVEFTPVSKNQDTFIKVLEGSLPLGCILEEGENAGTVVVHQLDPDSNAALAGLEEGDVLRACTACKMEMEAPTWQLLAGGIGRPKTVRMMYAVDFNPFEEVLEALGSNRMDPEGRPALLVVERKRQ